MAQALVVVVHRHRQDALGGFLADHVLIEQGRDFARRGQVRLDHLAVLVAANLVAHDVVAQIDALVADKDRRTGDQFLDFVLALAAERAVEQFVAAVFLLSHLGLPQVGAVVAVLRIKRCAWRAPCRSGRIQRPRAPTGNCRGRYRARCVRPAAPCAGP